MAENAVQNYADSCPLCISAQLRKFLVRPQHGIYFRIISGIIPVAALSLKHRIKIKHRNTKRLQIFQLFPYACNISSEKIIGKNISVFIAVILGRIIPHCVKYCSPLLRKSPRILPEKPVRKNLVHYALSEPRRCIRAFVIYGNLKRRQLLFREGSAAAKLVSCLSAENLLPVNRKLKPVPKQSSIFRQCQRGRKPNAFALRFSLQRKTQFTCTVLPYSKLSRGLLRALNTHGKSHTSARFAGTQRPAEGRVS